MKIISTVQLVLKFTGNLPTFSVSLLYKSYGYFILGIMILNLYPFILAMYYEVDSVMKFCQMLLMCMGALSAAVKASVFVLSSNLFRNILIGLQCIVDNSIQGKHAQPYEKFNKKDVKYSRVYAIFMVLSAEFLSFGPIVNMFFSYMHGNYDGHLRYPGDVAFSTRRETIWEYVLFYFFCALNVQLTASYLFTADAGFFGINLYLVAAFKDLADRFHEINISGLREGITGELQRKRQLIRCVYFHRELLRLIDSVQELYSPLIFFQFIVSCFQICAMSVEVIMLDDIYNDRAIQILPVFPTIVTILFIYCKFGNELFVEAGKFPTKVYFTHWYNYPSSIQKLLPLIIRRSQKPVLMTGFKFFTCTLENFTKALNTVGSMLAVMRQFLNK